MPSPRNRKILIALIILVGVIVTPILALKNVHSQPPAGKILQAIRGIGIAITMYARDHNGALPKTLHDLVPEYYPKSLLESTNGNPKGKSREWLYYYSLKRLEELPPDYILLASPEVLNVDNLLGYGGRKMRVVCFSDLEPELISESEFQERVEGS